MCVCVCVREGGPRRGVGGGRVVSEVGDNPFLVRLGICFSPVFSPPVAVPPNNFLTYIFNYYYYY